MKNLFGSMPSIRDSIISTDGHREVHPYKSIKDRLDQVLDRKK